MAGDDRAYKIALSGALPNDDINGWDNDDLAEDLNADRSKVRYAVISYTVHSTKEMTASGKKILTIQLHRIEPVPDDDADEFAQTMVDYYEERTGQTSLFPPGNEA